MRGERDAGQERESPLVPGETSPLATLADEEEPEQDRYSEAVAPEGDRERRGVGGTHEGR
jgi:hypothetical protein